MQIKGKLDDNMRNFFNGLQRDMPDEFQQKVTGYCCIYAPYYICMLETDDSEFMDYMMQEIQSTVGNQIHEQVWCLFSTEEVPMRAFDTFEVRFFPPQSSQAEIKALPMTERVQKIYLAMIQIGGEVRRVLNDPTKKAENVTSVFHNNSINSLPA